jgi:hypothetical protein
VEHVDWSSPAGAPSQINLARELANRQGWAVGVAHFDGNINDALQYTEDIIVLAEAMPHNGPSIISGLVASGLQALAAARVTRTAWYRPPGITLEQEREAWRSAQLQAKRVIARLLDEQVDGDLMEKSWRGERTITHRRLTAGLVLPTNRVTRPMLTANLIQIMEMQTEAAKVRSWTDRDGAWDAALQTDTLAGRVTTFAIQMSSPPVERTFIAFFRASVQRRLAAVIVAAKLYEADHGRLPTNLGELVPDYLPVAPTDPFDPAGHSLRLARMQGITVVYSVGEDSQDNGGSVKVMPGMKRTNGAWNREDLVYPLQLPNDVEHLEQLDPWHYLLNPAEALREAEEGVALQAQSDAEAVEEFEAESGS